MICRSVFSLLYLSALPSAAEPVLLFPNSVFEAGTLASWTASGAAFTRQPTYHDNTAARGNVPCGLQGNYWIGTYENYDGITGAPGDTRRDTPIGTLASQAFTIQKRYITFLMGGGNHPGVTGAKLVCEGREYPMATGFDSESMAPVTFDAQALAGKSATLTRYPRLTTLRSRFPPPMTWAASCSPACS